MLRGREGGDGWMETQKDSLKSLHFRKKWIDKVPSKGKRGGGGGQAKDETKKTETSVGQRREADASGAAL